MKKAAKLGLALLLVFLLLLGLIYTEGRKGTDHQADVVLVFGAMVQGEQLSQTLELRCKEALGFLQKNPTAKALLLGGQGPGEDISEAKAMKKYLVDAGIEESRLLLEEKSNSTWTNLQEAKKLIEKYQISQPILACSSDYHILRIKMLANRLDLEVYPLPAPTPKKVLLLSYVREVLALMKSFLVDR